MEEFEEKKLALFDAHLKHGGLKQLSDVIEGLLGNPLFMADSSMGIVFTSDGMNVDELSFLIEDKNGDRIKQIKASAQAGFLDWVYHHDEALLGELPGQPRYLSARVRDGAQVLGHVVVVEAQKQFTPCDAKLLPIICQTLSFELRQTHESDQTAVYAPLLRRLFEGSLVDNFAIQQALASADLTLPTTTRILALKTVNASRSVSMSYLRFQLQQAFPESFGIAWNDLRIQVIDGNQSIKEIEDILGSKVYLGGLAVGASRALTEVRLLRWGLHQAEAALRLSPGIVEGQLVSYDDVAAQHLLELVETSMPLAKEALVLPQLNRLAQVDADEHTDYLASLVAYLNTGRNVANAARALLVHKNSVYYRLKRISEITNLDLSDEETCFYLQLSLAMLGYTPGTFELEQFTKDH